MKYKSKIAHRCAVIIFLFIVVVLLAVIFLDIKFLPVSSNDGAGIIRIINNHSSIISSVATFTLELRIVIAYKSLDDEKYIQEEVIKFDDSFKNDETIPRWEFVGRSFLSNPKQNKKEIGEY